MQKKDVFTKILAIAGTVLAWIPILAPVLFAMVALIEIGKFRFDYLMPAEIFPIALVGGGLLLWAGLRARSRWKIVAWGLGSSLGLLVGSQLLAVVTGLASGETESVGIWYLIAITLLVIFIVAQIVTAVSGVLLLRDLFKPSRK